MFLVLALGLTRTVAALALIALGGVAIGSCGARTGLYVYGSDAGTGTGTDTGTGGGRCVKIDASAQHSALTVFIMLDTSGSMAFTTADGGTKALAVRNALADFFADPASAGLGVAEAFFPIQRDDVSTFCTKDADCGQPGACYVTETKVCLPSDEKTCQVDADCQGTSDPNDACYQLGLCANDLERPCIPGQPDPPPCTNGADCVDYGTCENKTVCDVDRYAKPVVDVGTLPGASADLLLALDTRVSDGATPTLPALEGALAAAGSWQDAHGGQKAIVLLATDGLPTACDPAIPPGPGEGVAGIPAVVDAAKAGVNNGVQTFVVGVFAPGEQQNAETALGQIADAGATGKAFVVSTDSDVAAKLVATFNKIRSSADRCEYSIPWPSGRGNDPDTLSVSIAGAPVQRVAGASACDPTAGGYYFDREPAPGLLPHRVILCPATCGASPPDSVHLQGACDG